MECPRCGAATVPGSKFCSHCGAAMARACPACGFGCDPADTFCRECGTALATPRAAARPAPAAEPAAERATPGDAVELKMVSVLFADLVGFTTLSEGRDPEDVRELLSRYFDLCRSRVERYGGVVEKFIGDAVMAVWGTPRAQEDDAERAVRAALDLVAAVQELGVEVAATGLAARAGVLTGTAAVTLGASGQGMVAGDLVNTASRIQGEAEAGTVLVGESTRRAAEAAIAFEPAGSRQLKGKAEPVDLYRAMRVVAGLHGAMKAERLEAPFVGRDRELRLVKELFHATAEEGVAHMVQVAGIAGIGKSRLAWEFFKYMDGLKELYFWHRGRCLAYGQGVTYYPLAEMVQGRAGILEGEDRESAQAKLRATVEQHVPDPEERSFVLPRLAQLVGLDEVPGAERQDLFAAWRLFFERLAQGGPVLMVFEDMQWADASLLDFIAYLMEWSRSYPMYLMCLARPEGEAATLGARIRNGSSIHLDPLPPAAMETLLRALVPGLPETVVQRIEQRSEGIPLYAVETVRMLLDNGLLVEDGSVYRPVGQIETLEVPETLQALLAARLDGLSPEERLLTQDAAVLGKTFTVAALAELTHRPEAELRGLLTALVAKEVFSVQADPRSPERGQYGFVQDLVRTVAYETLARRERRARHLAVAAALERESRGDDEELVEVLASHFLEAWRLDPEAADADEVRGRARAYLVRAAERAAGLAAAGEARSAFDHAAELADSPAERAELTERAGEMALLQGGIEEARSRFVEAERLFEEAGLKLRSAGARARTARADSMERNYDRALELMQSAYQGLADEEPGPDLAAVTHQLGRVLALMGRLEEAGPLLERALQLAEQLQLLDIYADTLSSKAILYTRVGRDREALLLLQGALEVAVKHGFNEAAQRALNNAQVLLEQQDRYQELGEWADRQLERARRLGDRYWEVSALTGKSDVLFTLGRWDEALALAEEAKASLQETPGMAQLGSGLVWIVRLEARRGELERAERTLQDFSWMARSGDFDLRVPYFLVRAELLREQGRPEDALADLERELAARSEVNRGLNDVTVKHALVLTGRCCLDLGRLERAEALLEQVRQAPPGQVSPWLRASCSQLSALVAAARGRDEEVEPAFEAAATGFEALSLPFQLAVVLAEHAEWLQGRGRPDRAGPLRARGREIMEQLQCRTWVARLAEPTAAERGVPA